MLRCALALLCLTACGSNADPDPPTDSGETTTAPAIRIVEPADSAVVDFEPDCSLQFDVVVEVEGITLVEFAGTEDVEGEGHWHFEISGDPAYTTSTGLTLTVTRPPGFATSATDLELSAQLTGHTHMPKTGPDTQSTITITTGPGCP